MTVFQAKDGLRFICLGMPMHLHDRAGKLASLLYKVEKPSVCLSAFLLRSDDYLALRIKAILMPNEAPIIWLHEVCCYKFLTTLLCSPWHLQCLAVEENFTYIPVKTAATNDQPLAHRTLKPEVQGLNPASGFFSVYTF